MTPPGFVICVCNVDSRLIKPPIWSDRALHMGAPVGPVPLSSSAGLLRPRSREALEALLVSEKKRTREVGLGVNGDVRAVNTDSKRQDIC